MDVPPVSTGGVFEPSCGVVVCVGAVVIGNEVDIEIVRDVAVDEFEERQPLLVAVPRFEVGEDLAGGGPSRTLTVDPRSIGLLQRATAPRSGPSDRASGAVR